MTIITYESLAPAQQARVDTLMSTTTDRWPPALLDWLNHEWRGPRRGDALVCALATWVAEAATVSPNWQCPACHQWVTVPEAAHLPGCVP